MKPIKKKIEQANKLNIKIIAIVMGNKVKPKEEHIIIDNEVVEVEDIMVNDKINYLGLIFSHKPK